MENSVQKSGVSVKGSIILMMKIWLYLQIYVAPFWIIAEILKYNRIAWAYIPVIEAGQAISYIFVIKNIREKLKKVENFQFKVKYKPTLKQCIFVIIATIAFIFVYDNSLGILMEYIPENEGIKMFFKQLGNEPFLIQFSFLCIIAPIFEEMICRGIILEQINKRCGALKAILISSLFFAILHGNIHQGMSAFFIGILMGYIYIKTDSLLLTILIHFVNNLYCLICGYIPYLEKLEYKFGLWGSVVGAIMLFIACRCFYKLKQNTKESLAA